MVTLPGPVALLREIALRGAIEQRALVLVGGPHGAHLADTAEGLGKEVLRLHVQPGTTHQPDWLATYLGSPEVDTVVMAHAEPGGAPAPLMELAKVVRRRAGVHLFVDATHTLGAQPLETDQWGLDLVLAASEGALGLPGFAFAALSSRLLARVRAFDGRGTHLDLVAHYEAAERGQSLFPTATEQAEALRSALLARG